MSDYGSTSLLNSRIEQILKKPSILKLQDIIFNYKNELNYTSNESILKIPILDQDKTKKIERKRELYNLINEQIIDTNIQEENLFTNKSKLYGKNLKYHSNISSNIIIEDLDLSYFVNDNIKLLIFYLQFMEQFAKNITDYLDNNYKIDNNIYNHEFEINTIYKLDSSTNKIISIENSYKIFFKLNKNYFDKGIGKIINLNSQKNKDTKIIEYMFENIDVNDIKQNLNIVNTNNIELKTKTGYVKYESLKLMLNNIILVLLYSYVNDNNNWNNKLNNIVELININNKIQENKIYIYESELRIIDNSNLNKNRIIEESDKIKEAIKTTNNLKKINDNIEDTSHILKNLNKDIDVQQKKLNKINIVLIISIILLISLTILLIFNKYMNSIYIYYASIITIILYIIIYIYTSSLKKTSKNIVEEFSLNNNQIFKIADNNIKNINIIVTKILKKNTENTKSYYDIINPLLNKELKNFKNKSNNNMLYSKIGKFNLNISKRDIKYNIETIIFLMNISILLILILLLINYNSKYLKIYGTIGIIIFILLAIIYFARILRVVRTKSNNYYWNKPIKEKEI